MPSVLPATRDAVYALWIAQTNGVRDNTMADIATALSLTAAEVRQAIRIERDQRHRPARLR